MRGERLNWRKYCVVCKKQYHSVLHKFPTDENLLEKWAQQTGITPSLKSRICHIHFDDSAWRRQMVHGKLTKILAADAVPTVLVGENAPPPDPECVVPHVRSGRVVCAICCRRARREDVLPIFDDHDYYSEFGVALTIILKVTSRVLTSRYSCLTCSRQIMKCFKSIIDINISTALTTRHRIRDANDEFSDCDDELALTEVAGRLKKAEDDFKGKKFKEKCLKCDALFTNVSDLSEHFIVHLHEENMAVLRRNIATTQVDEVLLEISANDAYMEELMKKDAELQRIEERKVKREKRREEPNEAEVSEHSPIHEALPEVDNPLPDDKEPDENEPFSPEGDDEDYVPDDEEAEKSAEELPKEKGEKERKRKKRDPDMPKPKKRWREPEIPGPRVCYLCGMKLKSHRTYITHMERHRNPEKFNKTCHLCGKRRVNIGQHVRLCRKDRTAKPRQEENNPARKLPSATCGVCGKKVCTMYLKRHLKGHEMEDDVAKNGAAALAKYLRECTLCGRRVKHLASHMVQHQKKGDIPKNEIQSNFDCEHCGGSFTQRTLLVNHMVLKHGADPKRRLIRGVRTKWTCSVCKQEFLSYNLIRKHTLAEHNGVGCDLTCEVCGKKYNARTSYIFHINSQHLDYFKYRCKQCGQYFVEEASFKEHGLFRCPSLTGGRRKRTANKEPTNPRPKPKRPPQEMEVRLQERIPEPMPNYNNIYSGYDPYPMAHLGNRYLQF